MMHEQNTGTYRLKYMVLFDLYVHVCKLRNTVRYRSDKVFNVLCMLVTYRSNTGTFKLIYVPVFKLRNTVRYRSDKVLNVVCMQATYRQHTGTYKLIYVHVFRLQHTDLNVHVCENLHTSNIHTHKAAAICLFYVPVFRAHTGNINQFVFDLYMS